MLGIWCLIIVICIPLLLALTGTNEEIQETKSKKPELSDEMKEIVGEHIADWSRYRRKTHSKLTFPEYMMLFYGKNKDEENN